MDAWSDIADEYATRVEPFTDSFVVALLDEIAPTTLEGVRLLDLACGAGALALTAAARGAHVVATDISPGMLRVLRQRLVDLLEYDGSVKSSRAASSVRIEEIVEADGLALPPRFANSFDAVASNFGLIFFDDVGAGCASAAACLVPGGTLAFSCWGAPEETEAFQVIKAACARCGIEATKAAPRRIDATVPLLTEFLTQGGLADIRVVGPVQRFLRVADAEAFWLRFSLASPATRRLLASLEPSREAELKAMVLSMLRERFGDGEVALPASAYFAVGVKPLAVSAPPSPPADDDDAVPLGATAFTDRDARWLHDHQERKLLDPRVRVLGVAARDDDGHPSVLLLYPLRQTGPTAATAAPAEVAAESVSLEARDDKRCKTKKKWTSAELDPWVNMYWLVHPTLCTRIGRLEHLGLVGAYQERLAADPAAKATMAAAHAHYGAARWSLLSSGDRAACEARGLAGVLRDTGVAGLRDTSGAHVKCLHTMTAHRLAQIAAGDLDPSRANVVGQWALDALAAGKDAQAGRVVEPNT